MRCLVLDDDLITAELIAEFARRDNYFQHVVVSNHPVQALQMIEKEHFDVLFLDIDMPEMSGLELLQTLKEPIICVLITSKTEHAIEAFEYGVVDYLVKPVRYHRFHAALQKIKDFIKLRVYTGADDDNVFIKSGTNQYVKIQLSKILYLEAMADYVIFHMEGGAQYLVLTTMKAMASKLPPHFLRVHRSFLVNYHKIDSVEDDSVIIQKKNIPLGGTYKALLFKHLKML
ncbi:MAG: LytTR family DNA-binding domain-containing protein [Cytophagales bacterium]|nr:LytTR family DNA-binding domain-containing protein [Bernardetiaceae bacterium]MDW8205427.1 LytTR family DNA-binding domain-containing protein [Cytophagales bacterium]